jgi:hypothetical protein
MNEQLISFETAKLAKEKGFCEESTWFYYDHFGTVKTLDWPTEENHNTLSEDRYSRPTQSLLQRWLREKQNIEIEIKLHFTDPLYRGKIWVRPKKDQNCSNFSTVNSYPTYEETLESVLQEALKLI